MRKPAKLWLDTMETLRQHAILFVLGGVFMEPQARFDIGRVFSRATGAIGRNLGLFLGLALILQGLPVVLSAVLGVPTQTTATGDLSQFTPVRIFAVLFGFVCTLLMQVTVTRATVIDLRGDRPTLADVFSGSFALLLPLIGLMLTFIAGFTLGLVLLVVPGIIVALMWSVAIPVLVTERKGVFASLGRSRELTYGSKWKILALVILGWMLLIVPTMIAMIMAGAFSPEGLEAFQKSTANYFVVVVNALLTVIFEVVLAAAYIELRFIKDGMAQEDLAAVFA